MENQWTDYYYTQAFPDDSLQEGGSLFVDMYKWGQRVEQRHKQRGGGFPTIYRGPVLQRGYGIGNMFKSLSRAVMPALKEGLKTVGKTALQTGLDVMQDVSRGENFKTAAKNRLKENSLGLLDDTLSGMTSKKPINKKQSQRKSNSSKKGRKRKHQKDTESVGDNIFTNFEKRRKI